MEAVAPQTEQAVPSALLLDALKRASDSKEHRLYRSGKLSGLFPNRTDESCESARFALTEGLLETIRVEIKGRWTSEWVRLTARGMAYIEAHDSTESVLRELKELLGTTRDGLPDWMHDTRQELARMAERFETRAGEMIRKLDQLTLRIEAALRRAEMGGPEVPSAISSKIPWAEAVIAHLDLRLGDRPRPLAELFQVATRETQSLSIPEFQEGVKLLHATRSLQLVPDENCDPEYLILNENSLCGAAVR